MQTTSNQHQTSAVDGMWVYGLAGIELGHRTRSCRSDAEAWLPGATGGRRGNLVRQWLGSALVRAGSAIAGHADPVPGTTGHASISTM